MMLFWCFTSLSTLFKSYRDDGRDIMKNSKEGFVPYIHDLDSTSSMIGTRDLVI